jgi:ATP-binding cassette subfamily F protein 3
LLIDSLNKYEGSLILVSHDRYFISKTANKIWEIEDQKVKEFKGPYNEWVEWKERMAKAANGNAAPDNKKKSKANETPPEAKEKPKQTVNGQRSTVNEQKGNDSRPAANTPINKDVKKELQKQQRIFAQLEEKIASSKEEQKRLEKSLGDPEIYSNVNKFSEAEKAYQRVTVELDRLNKEYEAVFEQIVDLESNLSS